MVERLVRSERSMPFDEFYGSVWNPLPEMLARTLDEATAAAVGGERLSVTQQTLFDHRAKLVTASCEIVVETGDEA